MEAWALARALHVIGVVFWIGGVAMVTTVLLPAIARQLGTPQEGLEFFERLEHRFAVQSRLSTLLVGATGFYLSHALGLWSRFAELRYWWMHAMVGVWALFTVMLFVLEPLVLHAWFRARAQRDPAGTVRLVLNLHRALLALSVVTVLGAVAGVHGLSLFG